MLREEIKKIIEKAIKDLQRESEFPIFEIEQIIIDYPRDKSHGDYSSNIAMVLARILKKPPIEVADILAGELKKSQKGNILEKIEAVQPGFVNFYISKKYLQNQVGKIIKEKDKFGDLKIGKGQKVQVEFISANPTGPLTLGNGRGGFCGDVLAKVLAKAGFKVQREYYINDTGEQIRKLGHSVLGDQEAVYKGGYIEELRKKIKANNPQKTGEKAAKIILEETIKPTIKKMGIKFDKWFSEKSLYKNGAVDKVIKELTKKGLTYKSEKAVWFKSKGLGDDKDRVLIRADGIKTYFASDIAYLKNKIKRGFSTLIMFLGADHYGYVARMKAVAGALGFEKENLEMIVMQMVRLFENGKEVKMSKRAGTYVTLDELLDEAGLDVARFFFLTRSADTHFNFDLNLAKEQSAKNPVFYVQYAYTRIASIIRKTPNSKSQNLNFNLLNHATELGIIKQLVKFPEVVEDTAGDYQIQRLPQYAVDLADAFHKFYENCRVITEDEKLTKARLSLVLATKIVLKNTFDLMGISAPEKM